MESVGLVVAARFCGPPDTGNGGYTAGLLAAGLSGGPVRVTLHQPPPLESAMVLAQEDGVLSATFGGAAFATARAAQSHYPGLVGHPFPGCFVCGPDRRPGGSDGGMGLHPGPVGDYG